jgi:hypothetical protein
MQTIYHKSRIIGEINEMFGNNVFAYNNPPCKNQVKMGFHDAVVFDGDNFKILEKAYCMSSRNTVCHFYKRENNCPKVEK